MKISALCVAVIIGLGLVVLPVSAHHSTSSVYDESKTIEVTGKVVEWQFVNPHPYLVVEVTTPDGKVELWDLSFGGSAVSHLTQRGYKRDTFKKGEIIITRGSPARLESVKGLLIRGNPARPDGSRVP